MPGLVGFISNESDTVARRALSRMRDAIGHGTAHVKDDVHGSECVWASRVHLDIIQRGRQPVRHADHVIWMDGEIHNRAELVKRHGLEVADDLELLAALIAMDPTYRILGEIDGFFTAALHDTRERRLRLVSDRYGLRHLYWTRRPDGVAWSSEVKSFLELPGFSPDIDRVALDQFLEIGYLLNDRTWFEDVKLLDTGCVLDCDLVTGAIETHRYWWWDDIAPRPETELTDDLIDELGHLFVGAVGRRFDPELRIGLTLSGGLDSRALLAAMPDGRHPLHAVTFGRPDCSEVRIAAQAAQVRGTEHTVVPITQHSWMANRIAGVWWTDGQLDFQHMHGIESCNVIRERFEVNMSGYCGDLILGGSYLSKAMEDDGRSALHCTAAFMACKPALLEGFDACAAHPSSDIYFLQNRVRRFTHGGLRHLQTSTENRLPFYDNRLIEFAYGLPDHIRRDGALYQRMLLRRFPDYFRRIPYQAFGTPIGVPSWRRELARWRRRIKRRANQPLQRIGLQLGAPDSCTDYANWLRVEPGRGMLEKLLGTNRMMLADYIHPAIVAETLDRHIAGENRAIMVSRYLTIEIWLQQVFNGRFRNGEDAHADSKTIGLAA